jgi:hypothetical protein
MRHDRLGPAHLLGGPEWRADLGVARIGSAL